MIVQLGDLCVLCVSQINVPYLYQREDIHDMILQFHTYNLLCV